MSTNTDRAGTVAGLRALADLLEQHPELDPGYTLDEINVPVSHTDNPLGEMAAWARAGKAAGLPVAKEYDDTYGHVLVTCGPGVRVIVYAAREKVCERVVVGTKTVTREVPDPDALAAVPTTTVTETVEKVEWRCAPLLAPAEVSA